MTENEIRRVVAKDAIEVHRTLGSLGLLESIHKEALAWELELLLCVLAPLHPWVEVHGSKTRAARLNHHPEYHVGSQPDRHEPILRHPHMPRQAGVRLPEAGTHQVVAKVDAMGETPGLAESGR